MHFDFNRRSNLKSSNLRNSTVFINSRIRFTCSGDSRFFIVFRNFSYNSDEGRSFKIWGNILEMVWKNSSSLETTNIFMDIHPPPRNISDSEFASLIPIKCLWYVLWKMNAKIWIFWLSPEVAQRKSTRGYPIPLNTLCNISGWKFESFFSPRTPTWGIYYWEVAEASVFSKSISGCLKST